MTKNIIIIKFKEIITRLFCTHDYNLVDRFVLKSEYDIVHESGRTPNTFCSITRKHIWDYKCSKCNKMKRLTNDTYS